MAGEFKGDFTRDTFYAYRHFCSVFQQQGRVSVEADANEQTSILLNLHRGVSKDIIADGDAPVGDQFKLISLDTPPGTAAERDFVITPGHVYVDGVLCALNGSKIPFTVPASGGSTVNVSQWLVDGIPWMQNQYVRAVRRNPDGSPDTVFTQSVITKADGGTRTLTLNPPPSFLAGAQNEYRLMRLPTFMHQPDYIPTSEEIQALKDLVSNQNAVLVYLDAWERHVSYVQNPWIREVALGGPDTCVRSQLLAQIKIAWDLKTNSDLRQITQNDVPALKVLMEDHYQPHNRGWLRARLKPVDPGNTDPCMCHPDARYRGAENQLYRVEIHQAGQALASSSGLSAISGRAGTPASSASGGATFKWSRNNASDVYPVISVTGAEVLVDTVGRDDRSCLKSGDWVELLDDILILQGKPGQLLQVSEVSAQDRRVTLVAPSSYNVIVKDPSHPHAFLRRWDEKDTSTGGVSNGLPITEGNAVTDPWIDLEDGIQIQFMTALSPLVFDNQSGGSFVAPVNNYRTGDYWLIPARVALQGSIEWPVTTADNPGIPIALPPHGVDHHYFPLGIVTLSGQALIGTSFVTAITKIT